MSNLGSNLRKTRESLGLPIETIAAETRISTRFLTAIENEEFQVLPGGIFTRGFIRSYAEHLGLNAEAILADYDRLNLSEESAENLHSVERASMKNSERHLYPAAAVLLIVLVAGYYFATRNSSAGTAPKVAPVAATAPAPTAPPVPASPETEPAPLLTPEFAPNLSPAGPFATPTAATTVAPAPAAVVPVAATPISPPAAPTTTTVSSPPAATNTAGPATTPPLVLILNTSELSWVKVTADGSVSQSGELPAGSTRRFTANTSIGLSVGNAGGTSVKINGRDRGPLGQHGEVRQLTITPANAASIQ